VSLTARQQAFVDAYAGNGVAACRAAGYGGHDATLATQASKLLKMPKVQAALEQRRAKVEAAAADRVSGLRIASRAERQAWWTRVMEDPGEEMPSRLKASELLGKSEGDFLDRTEHTGNVTITVIDPYAKAPK
jgi:phage terminase small subunit